MATLRIPAGGGQICLEVKYTQNYECEDGSSGTYNCVASCEDISWTPDIADEYKEYVTWNSSTCCLSSTWDGGQGDCVKIGELKADVEVNGVDGSSTVEIYQGDCGEDPVCEYGPVVINLSFDRMPYTGGYSSRVCANYSYSQTNTLCAGGTETLTSGGVEIWSFEDIYGATSMTEEGDTMCLIGPANEGTADRVVSNVTLSVRMPDGTEGTASCAVIQGYSGCSYSNYNIKFTNSDGNVYDSIVFDSEGGTQCIRLRVYATETCGDGTVTENADVTSMMGDLELGYIGDGFSMQTDPDNPQNGICITAQENESADGRNTNACVTFFSPSYVLGCIELIQYGESECTYSDIDLSGFSYYREQIPACGGSISPWTSPCYQYKTCGGTRTCNNSNMERQYEWVGLHIEGAELDEKTGTVTYTESNMTSTETRQIGIVRLTASFDGETARATYTIYQEAGDGNVYENPCIEEVTGNNFPAEGGNLNLSLCYQYWQFRNCDEKDRNTCNHGEGCEICESSNLPDANCGSATITYELLRTYDGIEVSLSDDGILITEHVNGTDDDIAVADIKVTVSWHCLESELTFTVYQTCGTATCEYEEPVINLEYDTYTIPYQGGEFCPTFSYNQHWECNDDTSGDISDGAEMKWTVDTTIPAEFRVYDNGCIWVDSAEVGRDLGTVTVTVTLNGESNSKTVAFTQAGEVAGEWNYPQVSVNYANIPKNGGSTKLTLNVTSYKYDESGNVVDTRTLSYVDGVKTYDDYGDDMTEFYIEMMDEISGTTFNEETYEITQNGENTAAAARFVCYIDCYVVAFHKAGDGGCPVYQDGETETYIASNDVSSQYTALIGTIENRNLAEIQVYADRYEDGQVQETGVLIAQFGYKSNKILSSGDVFYGHFNDGISCGEYHINKLGMRGYNEQGYPQYSPHPFELRIDNNYLGDLTTPPEIEGYSTEIPPIYIYNSGSTVSAQATNCELHFYRILYSQ
ncbi:MAG: hypothetical protein LUD72_06170 [Bacteroidales bacterium]|nr:hypothetical protein [Bacteroidales bacterium]